MKILKDVLFRLGLLVSLCSIAVLEYLNFGRTVVWVEEFDRVTAVTVIGIVMMGAAVAMDIVPIARALFGKHSRK